MNFEFFKKLNKKDKIFTVDNIMQLKTCDDFFRYIVERSQRAKEVYIACLALGSDEKSNLLIHVLKERVKKGLKTVIFADKTRNVTDKPTMNILIENDLIPITTFVDAEVCRFLPMRINEALGVFHSKAYVFDSEVVISGANLYKSYYVDRVDRYFVFNDVTFAEYIIKVIFDIKCNLTVSEYNLIRDKKIFNYNYLKNINVNIVPFDNKNEVEILLKLFNSDFVEMHISSAYLNLRTKYINSLKDKQVHLYAPAPENNTFNTFGFINRIITDVYGYSSYYTKSILSKCILHEFVRNNHSFHKKGIWLFYKDCAINIIGSSNYNARSTLLDIEQNFILFTKDDKIIKLGKDELAILKDDCKIRELVDLQSRRIFFIILIFYIFNFLF